MQEFLEWLWWLAATLILDSSISIRNTLEMKFLGYFPANKMSCKIPSISSGMKESPWHMVDVLRPRLFSRFMFLDRKVIKRRQESLIPLTFQEQLSFFSVSRGRNVGGIALELLVEQVKCYVSTNHLLGRHFFCVEEVNLISTFLVYSKNVRFQFVV